MRYEDFSVEDFLTDEGFKNWVLYPDENSNSYWNSLITAHPSLIKRVKLAKEILLSVRTENKQPLLASEEREKIFKEILKNRKSERSAIKESKIGLPLLYKVAAVVVLALGISFYFMALSSEVNTQGQSETTWVHKFNPNGRSSTIVLPDQSVVNLAANSELKYPSDFASDKREVWLKGKAFLEVTENKDKPFYVHTGNLYTKVLGTSFNVSTSGNGSSLAVVLVTGKVLVEDVAGTVSELLLPNQKLTVDQENEIIIKSPLHYDHDLAWKDGILVLEKESLESLKEKLENWYGAKISIGKIKGNHQFTGRFSNKSLEYVMEAIAYTSSIEYQLNGKELTIKSKQGM